MPRARLAALHAAHVTLCAAPAAGLDANPPACAQVFAARRLDDPVPDSWQMPQGGIDPGESPEEAAVRVSSGSAPRCCAKGRAAPAAAAAPPAGCGTAARVLVTVTVRCVNAYHTPQPTMPRSCLRRSACAAWSWWAASTAGYHTSSRQRCGRRRRAAVVAAVGGCIRTRLGVCTRAGRQHHSKPRSRGRLAHWPRCH